MDIFTLTTDLASKEILTVGFQDSFYSVFGVYPDKEGYYNYTSIDNSFNAYQWLVERYRNTAEDSYHPHAIICDLSFLQNDNYYLLKSIQRDPLLKQIPFIAIAQNGSFISASEALAMGIDDCYSEPVSWNQLRKRIEFLSRFKVETLKAAEELIEEETYKIPLGKRLFDIAFASTALLILSPILALIAILVKLESRGPIIYKSKRVGTGYDVFNFLKFRSMCQDADAKLENLAHLNQYSEGDDDSQFVKLTNDPRITRVGKIIRKTSLDELPQLFNVLRGDMSIVGNRPLPMYEAEKITKDDWAGRFMAPAGITGLWQVSPTGKDNMTADERMQLDIEYATQYSFLMDIKIISKTIPAMIQKEA